MNIESVNQINNVYVKLYNMLAVGETCFSCADQECRKVQMKSCDLKQTTCAEWRAAV